MITPELLRATFDAGLSYPDYLRSAKPTEIDGWRRFDAAVRLLPEQAELIRGFVRSVNILVSSGTWCGDCVQQVPMLARFEEANPQRVKLRIVDRDVHADFSSRIKICGGARVPVVVFVNEDFEFLSLLGDRTLARYRAAAARQLGASCPLPGAPVPADEVEATLADWLGELERVQLLLRLSTKLRQRHGD